MEGNQFYILAIVLVTARAVFDSTPYFDRLLHPMYICFQ